MNHNIAVSTEVLEFLKSCVKESRAFYSKLDNQYSTNSTKKTIKDHNKVLGALNDITVCESLADDLDFILEAINEQQTTRIKQ